MNIELNIENDETITLTPFKKVGSNGELLFDLIDDNKKVWIEIELVDHDIKILKVSNRITEQSESLESKLDELLHAIIEIEKSGADTYNENDPIELNPYDPEKIKVRTDKIPVTLIAQMIDDNEIDLNPDFQRNLVWDNFQKSRLIESILLRIPLPMFYFAEDKEGKLSVVDGLQRITTIKDFMDNKFPLRKLQYLKESCDGKYYETKGRKKGIDSKYYRWFNLTNLSANIIDPSSPFKVKYDIFRRINTGGRPLNNQEIRNCLTGQGLRDILKAMTSLEEFKSATDFSIKSKRMDDQEIALRFLLFLPMVERIGNIEEYNGYMDSSLDELTERHIKTSVSELQAFVTKFSRAMKNAEYLIGSKYAFRKILPKDTEPNAYKQLINKALFVCTSILLAQYEPGKVRKLYPDQLLLRPIAQKIHDDRELLYFLSYGTNGRNNLIYTFNVLKQLFEKHLK